MDLLEQLLSHKILSQRFISHRMGYFWYKVFKPRRDNGHCTRIGILQTYRSTCVHLRTNFSFSSCGALDFKKTFVDEVTQAPNNLARGPGHIATGGHAIRPSEGTSDDTQLTLCRHRSIYDMMTEECPPHKSREKKTRQNKHVFISHMPLKLMFVALIQTL